MRVTPEMTTEGGGRLDKLADFLDADGRGAKVAFSERGDQVKFTAASTEWPAVSLYFDADDTEALGVLLIQRAAELRARS
jgi:hypothetical protein